MIQDKKTFIFFPIEAGLAHITRSLSIAEELVSRKHRVIFTLSKDKQHLIRNKQIEVINIGEFFSDGQLVEKIKDPVYIYSFIQEELKILKKYKPDVAIIDFRLSAIVSCKILNIPSVFITNSDGLFFNFHLPSLGLPKLFQFLLNPILQFLIANFKTQYLNSLVKAAGMMDYKFTLDDLFDMTTIIPEPVDYLPVKKHKANIHYVGPIWWDGFEAYVPFWLKDIKPDGKTIYLTFGGTGYDSQKLINLSELLIAKGYRVIVSASNIARPDQFKKLKNLYVEKYLSGFEICKKVDVVVCHGGIGTLAQALISKKPVVVVPFNPDQYLHGYRFQELGLGKCVANLNLANLLQLDWQNFQQKGRELSAEKILKAVEEILGKKEEFKESINKFSKKFSRFEGSKKAASVIENLV